ncbi:hypothetical protein DL546_002330 [Coniochaeta pulveracea]|uniref:Uncharacterized protein n=1 Tax=Coniochaeta pulveracea TaxID=177199 RepID=A0A420XYP8_9PEZI|nr:hypothetical protein DL546_002330 [Coniochaeta pulveracea]
MSSNKRKSEEEHSPVRRSSDTLGVNHTDAECPVLRHQVINKLWDKVRTGLSRQAEQAWVELEVERKLEIEYLQNKIEKATERANRRRDFWQSKAEHERECRQLEKDHAASEAKSKEEEYTKNLKSAWDQIRDERAKNAELSEVVGKLRAENEELKVDVEELQNGDCGGCEKWEALHEALQEEYLALDSACEELNESNEQLVTRKNHLAEELEEEKAETAHYKQKYEQALAANTNAVQLQQQLDYEREVKQQLYDHLQNANATIQSLKEQVVTLQSQLDHETATKEQLCAQVNDANTVIQQYQAEAHQTIHAKDQVLLQEQSTAVSLRVQLQAVTVELERERKIRQEQVTLSSQHADAQVTELRQIIDQERQRSSHLSSVIAHIGAQLSAATDENSGLSGQLAALQQVTAEHQEESPGLASVKAQLSAAIVENSGLLGQLAALQQVIAEHQEESPGLARVKAQLSTATDEKSGLSGQLAALQQVTAGHQEKSPGLVAASLSVYERAKRPKARVKTLETLLAAVSVPVPADVYERASEPHVRVQILDTLLAAALVPLPEGKKKKKKQEKPKKKEEEKKTQDPCLSSSYSFTFSSPYPAPATPSTLPSSPPQEELSSSSRSTRTCFDRPRWFI